MDCSNARLFLTVAGRQCQELTPADRRLLDQHLRACPDCASLAHDEELVDEVLGRAMAAVPVPANLSRRILDSVATRVRPRYWPWVAAAAASVLLATGLGLFFYLRPGVKLNELIARDMMDHTNAGPDGVERWFEERGVTMKAPRQFRYGPAGARGAYLDSANIARVDGHDVPHLFFIFPGDANRDSAAAHVYVLPAHATGVIEGGGPLSPHTVEMRPYPDARAPQYVFMIAYTGDTLEPFLAAGEP